jgi:hypothetical protein
MHPLFNDEFTIFLILNQNNKLRHKRLTKHMLENVVILKIIRETHSIS